jgi:cell division protein FtsA
MEIKRSGYSRHLAAGVVLTGGGALIKGVAELAREVLGMPVKIGIPSGFTAGLVREIENPIYATCVGLVLHGLRNKETSQIEFRNGNGKGKIKQVFNKMKSWFNEM